MISLDTNTLLRYALADHQRLSPLAHAVIASQRCHVTLLALAEAGFVLTSLYRVTKAELLALMRGLLALPTLQIEHEKRVAQALDGFEAGLDWFDAMLWAASPAHPVATFDRKFARKSAQLGWQPAVECHLPERT